MSNTSLDFLAKLEDIIRQRTNAAPDSSYTAELLHNGTRRIAQKVGEEAVEVALAACANEPAELLDETADLLYHLLVLLADRDLRLGDAVDVLERRHNS